MNDWTEFIVPPEARASMPPCHAARKKERGKCSTCSDRRCRRQFMVVQWKNCRKWTSAERMAKEVEHGTEID